MYNPLNNHPKIREYLYGVWWAVSGVIGAFGAYYAATPGQIPAEYNISVLIVSFAGVYLGFTAQSNVTGTDIKGLPTAAPKETLMSNPAEETTPEVGAQPEDIDADALAGEEVDDPTVAEEDK
jgi:hypothetical protein